MFKKLIKFIMNITKFHKIPTGENSNSKSVVFPKIGLFYNLNNKILLYKFSDNDINFPLVAFNSSDAPQNTKVIFEGNYDATTGKYIDNTRNKSTSALVLTIFKDDTNSISFGVEGGEAVSTLLGISPEIAICIAGKLQSNDNGNYKFAAIMNGTSGYGYYSEV